MSYKPAVSLLFQLASPLAFSKSLSLPRETTTSELKNVSYPDFVTNDMNVNKLVFFVLFIPFK